MKLEPQERYPDPRFPTRVAVDREPELLRRVPVRWRGSAVVMTAAALAGVLVASTRAAHAEEKANGHALVAPIFPHGGGRGGYGGPGAPDFVIDEGEARDIISQEFKAVGLDPKADTLTVPNVAIPVTRYYHDDNWDDDKGPGTRSQVGPLELYVMDARKHIAVEFVSEGDYWEWSDEPRADSAMYIQDAAQRLRDSLGKTAPPGAYGVFYNPVPKGRYDEDITHEEAVAQLRLQVKDFVAWLKAQQVI